MRRWTVLDGKFEESHFGRDIFYSCPKCEKDAILPVEGIVIAQLAGGGLIFDGGGSLPAKVRCPHCRTAFER